MRQTQRHSAECRGLVAAAMALLLVACASGGGDQRPLPSPWDWEDNRTRIQSEPPVAAPAAVDPVPQPRWSPPPANAYRSPDPSLGIVVPSRPDQPVIYGVTPAHPVDPRALAQARPSPAGPIAEPPPMTRIPEAQRQTGPAAGAPPPGAETVRPPRMAKPAYRAPEAAAGIPSPYAREDAPGGVELLPARDPFGPPAVATRDEPQRLDPYSRHIWQRPGSSPRPAVPSSTTTMVGPAPAVSAPPPTRLPVVVASRGDTGNWPGESMPAPPYLPIAPSGAFVLGPGDVIAISVYGQPELATTAHISDRGRVRVPLAGEVLVSGLSPNDAAGRIADAYREQELLVNPQVNVTVSEYRSQQVSVIGEVRSPGRFPIETRMSVLDALALAGGITELGDGSVNVLRHRGGQTMRYTVDLDGYLSDNRAQGLFELRAGDTVVAPKAKTFYIYGEVRQPNAYRLEADMTVVQALSLSGGLTERGTDQRIEIKRKLDNGQLATLPAELNSPVHPNDVIYVRERIF